MTLIRDNVLYVFILLRNNVYFDFNVESKACSLFQKPYDAFGEDDVSALGEDDGNARGTYHDIENINSRFNSMG